MNRAILLLCLTPILGLPPSSFKPGPRIINGIVADKGQFPWQVALYVSLPGSTNLCGGALISDSWILTAGHCVIDATNFKISLGSTVLTGEDSGRVVLDSSNYILHENYNRFTLANDIAVIQLPEPVTLTDTIQPIELSSEELQPDTSVLVSGWGLTSDGGSSASNDLMYVGLDTISDEECADAYGGALNEGVVCAQGVKDVAQGTCEGDSGGPLVTDSDTHVHVGVVSFGHSDGCESGKPVGFTRTAAYRDWIREKTGV